MTQYKNKPGRPAKIVLEELKDATMNDTYIEKERVEKIGNFLTVNTVNVKGLRINLANVESYAPNGETSLQIARANGNVTMHFPSKEAMQEALDKIDARCL